MRINSGQTLIEVSKIFSEAVQDVLGKSSGADVWVSPTVMKIPNVNLKPDVGCFVQFSGDYSGLIVTNFSADASMELYRLSMLRMGMTEEELATHYTSSEVVDSVGEMINQVIGNARQKIEQKYGLTAKNTQPKAIALNTAIVLSIDTRSLDQEQCRKIIFKVNNHPFYLEFSLEKTEFLALNGENIHERQVDEEAQPVVDIDSYFD